MSSKINVSHIEKQHMCEREENERQDQTQETTLKESEDSIMQI